MTTANICRHKADEALCVVEECRAKGLVEVIRELVEVGSPHEDVDCPEDDTCECKLAARVNAVLRQDAARKAYQKSKEEKRCASTYRQGEFRCEKDGDHLRRVGDVPHQGGGHTWLSV